MIGEEEEALFIPDNESTIWFSSQVARHCGVTRETVWRWHHTGALLPYKVMADGTRLYRRSAVEVFAKRREENLR